MSAYRENDPVLRWLALIPALTVIGVFMLIPMLIMAGISVMEASAYGGVHPQLSLEAYVQLAFDRDLDDSLIFNPAYAFIILRSVLLASGATLCTLVLGFPVAWFMARQPAERRNLLLFLVTVPFWTNLLVRAFAWVIILGRGGVLDAPFKALGLIDETLGLLYTDTAILIGLTYTYLPLMVLPIYASLEKIDFRLVEAAADLYAGRWEVMRCVVVPLAAPGIIAGALLVFVPALGDFISPDLLGGAKHLTLGSLVQLQFATSRNWPFGSAVAMVLLAFVALNLALYAWLMRARAAGERT